MACFLVHNNDTTITIPQVENTNNIVFYIINVKVGPVEWSVKQRYNGFLELHEILVSDHSVAKDLLPPKKIIGNKDPVFIEKRRAGLETYLQTVITFLQKRMPRELVIFLDMHSYEILFLLQEFSMFLFQEGENLLFASKKYTFCPLKLHAISERLKQPCPPLEIFDKRHDFSHILDFCSQLMCIKIEGGDEKLGTSNIVLNQLSFELSVFKLVETLGLSRVNCGNIYGLGTLRETIKSLSVRYCRVRSLGEVFLCDEVHKTVENVCDEKVWKKLDEADFSHNEIAETDEVLRLAPNLKRLMISHNQITKVSDMTFLPKLTHLSLSANNITELDDLSKLFKRIVYLDLSQNNITSLKGFENLQTLEGIDLSTNAIKDMAEVQHIVSLKLLDYLNLSGNPVTTIIDYRVKVLEKFGSRAGQLCLDNEKPTQKELDTVSVLQALRIVKEGRTPTFNVPPPFPNTFS
ncbi:nischarin [Nilaparvata lugens]|uniref:nischarin n=1 Tax=Nilaparvata lugens TaxID=108931 RepID=UPI00193DA995|nr:nischarin [Nilaparvata lugens]